MLTLWNPMVPGQLNYVLLGECASGEHPWGFGQGYYLPRWDQDAYYEAVGGGGGIVGEAGSRADDVEQGDVWTGYYQKIEVTNKKDVYKRQDRVWGLYVLYFENYFL